MFLSGEAGIGKTTVLDTFLARAASDPDLLIARGTCLEHYGAAEAHQAALKVLGDGAARDFRIVEGAA